MHCITCFQRGCCSNTNGLHAYPIPVLHMLKKEGSRKCMWNLTFLEHVFAHDMGLKKIQKNSDDAYAHTFRNNLEIRKPVYFCWMRICFRNNSFCVLVTPPICIFCAVNISRIASGLGDCFLNIFFYSKNKVTIGS